MTHTHTHSHEFALAKKGWQHWIKKQKFIQIELISLVACFISFLVFSFFFYSFFFLFQFWYYYYDCYYDYLYLWFGESKKNFGFCFVLFCSYEFFGWIEEKLILIDFCCWLLLCVCVCVFSFPPFLLFLFGREEKCKMLAKC